MRCCPIVMAKAMLLQQRHALSDPEMEEALDDRILFWCFVGMGFGMRLWII